MGATFTIAWVPRSPLHHCSRVPTSVRKLIRGNPALADSVDTVARGPHIRDGSRNSGVDVVHLAGKPRNPDRGRPPGGNG